MNTGKSRDFAQVRQTAADLWISRKGDLDGEARRKRDELRDLETAHQEISEELAQWESSREPEPPRSDAVQKNRERLREKGIPYQEFYKVVEFGKELSEDPKRCGRLGRSPSGDGDPGRACGRRTVQGIR